MARKLSAYESPYEALAARLQASALKAEGDLDESGRKAYVAAKATLKDRLEETRAALSDLESRAKSLEDAAETGASRAHRATLESLWGAGNHSVAIATDTATSWHKAAEANVNATAVHSEQLQEHMQGLVDVASGGTL